MKRIINTETLLKGLLSVVFIILFTLFLSFLGLNTDVLSPLKQAMDSYRLTDVYFSSHKGSTPISHEGRSVVLVDISSCETRSDIATVIDRINEAEPFLVALDVIFPKAVSADKTQDDSLVAAMSRVKNLVLAEELRPVSGTEYRRISSFFADFVAGLASKSISSTKLIVPISALSPLRKPARSIRR